MRKNLKVIILIVFLFLVCKAAIIRADQNLFGLDTTNSYDIYMGAMKNPG